jgi:hypothetical protein
MRAAFHPDGHVLYVTTLARLDPDRYLVHLRTFEYSRTDCSIGPLLASSEVVSDTASNTRIYGLVAHPNGRWLFQTTGSSRRIRLYLLGEDGVPLLRDAYDVTRGGTVMCAQVRRLLLSPTGRKLYSNCNNEDAGAGVDLALQTWDIAEDGALQLIEHHTIQGMDNGIADPVLHPSGRWLYQPVGTVDPSAPQGFGAYILTFAVDQDGALRFHQWTPVRVFDQKGPLQPSPYTKVFPSTLAVHPDGTHLYAAVNAMLDMETFPHEFVEYRIEEDGGELVEVGRTPVALPLLNSSHHGGAIIEVGRSHLFYSYLTDYDTIRGGVLQQYRIGSGHRLEPLEIPYVVTGLMDARQPIAAPDAM